MSRLQRLSVYVVYVVRMEDARLAAVEDRLLARRIRESETPPAWSLAGRAHNRNALRHHDLIPHVRVQVPTRHEARLARMCVYPPQHHQLFLVAVVEQVALVCHLARIARARLRGDDKPRDEQRVVFQYAAQDTTRLEVEPRVPFGGGEEVLAQGGGEEDGAEWIAVLQVGGGLEGELV